MNTTVTDKFAETDLYEPIKQLLVSQGFTVKGEVKRCDIAAVKEDTLWVVEMKLHFNITLLYQAMERLVITDQVFVAVPRPRRANDKNYRMMRKVLQKLELGLITVSMDSPCRTAEIILFPGGKLVKNNKASARVLREIAGRVAGDTAGGSKTIINTAYRERCIRVACLFKKHGVLSARTLTTKHGCEKDSYNLLRANHYGWFRKIGRGQYTLTLEGEKYLQDNENSGVVAYYRMKAEEETDNDL